MCDEELTQSMCEVFGSSLWWHTAQLLLTAELAVGPQVEWRVDVESGPCGSDVLLVAPAAASTFLGGLLYKEETCIRKKSSLFWEIKFLLSSVVLHGVLSGPRKGKGCWCGWGLAYTSVRTRALHLTPLEKGWQFLLGNGLLDLDHVFSNLVGLYGK